MSGSRLICKPLGFGVLLLLALCGGQGEASPVAKPGRIMSLTICTDELLMSLVPPDRILSLSYLSREKAALRLFPEAAHIPVNRNSAEEILADKPDLVLTLPYASSAFRPLVEKNGTKIVEVPEVENFDQIRAVTRMVGKAVGEGARAEQLIAQMDAQLRQLAARKPLHPVRVVAWNGSGYLAGRGSLFDTVLEAAGGSNVGSPGYTSMESLIALHPDVLAQGDEYKDMPSLQAGQAAHPLLLKLFGGRRVVYPSALIGCGLPQSAGAALALQSALKAAMRNSGGVP